jgi:hypothetical protein
MVRSAPRIRTTFAQTAADDSLTPCHEPPPTRRFERLVDELEAIELRRFEAGEFGSARDRARHDQIQVELSELLSTHLPAREHRRFVRVPCDLWVSVRLGDQTKPGIIDNVGAGGFFVSTVLRAQVGDVIEVELDDQEPIKLRGMVVWTGGADRQGLGVEVPAEEQSSTGLRRFVIELLRSYSGAGNLAPIAR